MSYISYTISFRFPRFSLQFTDLFQIHHPQHSTVGPPAFFDFGHLQRDHRGTRRAAGDLPIALHLFKLLEAAGCHGWDAWDL